MVSKVLVLVLVTFAYGSTKFNPQFTCKSITGPEQCNAGTDAYCGWCEAAGPNGTCLSIYAPCPPDIVEDTADDYGCSGFHSPEFCETEDQNRCQWCSGVGCIPRSENCSQK